jgi:hypothetical protein
MPSLPSLRASSASISAGAIAEAPRGSGKERKQKKTERKQTCARACRHSRRYRAVAASRAVAVTVSRSLTSLPSHCEGASRAVAAAARGKSCQSLFTSSPVPAELERACRHLPPAASRAVTASTRPLLAASRVMARCPLVGGLPAAECPKERCAPYAHGHPGGPKESAVAARGPVRCRLRSVRRSWRVLAGCRWLARCRCM